MANAAEAWRELGPFWRGEQVIRHVRGIVDLSRLIAFPAEKDDGSIAYFYPRWQFRENSDGSFEPREFVLGVFNEMVRDRLRTPGDLLHANNFRRIVEEVGEDPTGQGLLDGNKVSISPAKICEPKNIASVIKTASKGP